jgi:hypothetical protein
MFSRSRIGLLALACALAALALPTTASASGSGCRDGAYCLWTGQDFEGKKRVVESNGIVNLGPRMNNKVSSLKNHKDRSLLLYLRFNAQGDRRCVLPGEEDPGLLPPFDNAISSTNATPRDITTCL